MINKCEGNTDDMNDTLESRKGLSSSTLKLIAIVAMLIDHIAWAFVPTYSILGQVMHIIGRLTAPIMCYFIAEGYYHTRNVKRYAIRLGVFALISHIPFYYFEYGRLPVSFENGLYISFQTSVMYTLFLGLIALIIWNKKELSLPAKIIAITLICYIAIPGDWMFISVLWILFFGKYHGNFKKQMISFSIIAIAFDIYIISYMYSVGRDWTKELFQFAVLLAIPLIALYNGKRGGNKFTKWGFYVFYPLHLLIIGFMKFVILG